MQQQKVSMSKKLMTIEDLAKELNVKKFLVRLWEKEFKLKPEHAGSGTRCYSQENLKIFATIKDLIINKKMTISQAKKQLNELPLENVATEANKQEEQLPPQENETPTVMAAAEEIKAPQEEIQGKTVIPEKAEQTFEAAQTTSETETQEQEIRKSDDLVQPALSGQNNEEDIFLQNLRTLKEQLINLKQQLDLD